MRSVLVKQRTKTQKREKMARFFTLRYGQMKEPILTRTKKIQHTKIHEERRLLV